MGALHSISDDRGDESFADDLNMGRGIVSGRVALLLRSTEIRPHRPNDLLPPSGAHDPGCEERHKEKRPTLGKNHGKPQQSPRRDTPGCLRGSLSRRTWHLEKNSGHAARRRLRRNPPGTYKGTRSRGRVTSRHAVAKYLRVPVLP